MPLTYYWRQSINAFRDVGWKLLFWKVLVKLVAPLGELSIEILYEKDLTPEIAPLPSRLDVTIREASEDDIDLILALEGLPLEGHAVLQNPSGETQQIDETEVSLIGKQYRERLSRGEKCFLAFAGPELVHSNWLCRKWGEAVPGHPVILLPGEIYETDAFTAPAWRGWGLQKFVHNEILRYGRSVGCHRAYTMANLYKVRSRRGTLSLGYRLYGVLLYFLPRRIERVFLVRLRGRWDVLFREGFTRGPDALESHQVSTNTGLRKDLLS